MPAIQLSDVVKRYAEHEVLKGVTLTVAESEVMVLLGHKGAGKTVTARLVSTISWPTSGSISVCGLDTRTDSAAVRQRIGVCLDTPLLSGRQSGREHVHQAARGHGLQARAAWQEVDKVLERLGLTLPHATPVEQYSLGMKRKLGLALSLLHRPPVLIWDEPETGLDAVSRARLRALIADLRRRGAAVLVTTQSLEIAEQLGDRIAVLSHGVIAAVDTTTALRANRQKDPALDRTFRALLAECPDTADSGSDGVV